jgi:carbonic anhydrase
MRFGFPTPKIAVETCVDPRLSNLPEILGLPHADIDVIMLLNNAGCGFTTFTDDEMNAKLTALAGDASPAPMRFFSYKEPEQNTWEQIKKVRSHPWIAKEVPVRGFIFDVETGLIGEVQPAAQHTAA